jgi:uncharacterized protein (DUF1800 family)
LEPGLPDPTVADHAPTAGASPSPALNATLAAAVASALAACGGGGGGGDAASPGAASGASTGAASGPMSTTDAARFLAQSTLGASRIDITSAASQGAATWIEQQFVTPPTDGHYDWMLANGYGAETNRFSTAGLDASIWRKFIGSPDALRQRMVLALSEILVVSVLGVDAPWRQFAIGNYLDVLERNAFGNYRSLLGEVTLSTAMGYYLTYRGNTKANGRGSQPDENYARELMQLFTIGLLQLNADGTVAAGNRETYGPDDVSGLARVFTGWDLDTSGLNASSPPPDIHRRPMVQVGTRYEPGAKTFLGVTIPANTGALVALNTALDTLFNHPNLPPFISRQLIQRLVTSNPSPAYVGRVAAAFANSGGVRGDLKAVLRAILLDPEARNAAQAANPAFGKLREPVVRFLNWARAFGATSPSGAWAIGDLSDASSRLGQSPMRSGSVFNFFRPGYVPPGGSIAAAGLAGPEFQIANETSVVGYLNFMQRAIAGNGIGDVRADYTALLAIAGDSAALLNEINLVLAAGQVPPATIATLRAALDTISAANDTGRRNRVQAALMFVLAAPEYIAQK